MKRTKPSKWEPKTLSTKYPATRPTPSTDYIQHFEDVAEELVRLRRQRKKIEETAAFLEQQKLLNERRIAQLQQSMQKAEETRRKIASKGSGKGHWAQGTLYPPNYGNFGWVYEASMSHPDFDETEYEKPPRGKREDPDSDWESKPGKKKKKSTR